ncbi:MAG: nucleotide exchange factor GrpE [Gammaproteobacteria bacterium]|tara:strand:+ start:66 stop:641 length:576 start_codon:yes stop_codon:yes gene_type:complete
MTKKDKSIVDDIDNKTSEDLLNDNSDDLENDISDAEGNEDLGTPSYEELFDKNEELEKQLLRSNADLDNALKRTLSEVEKAHKYGIEKLLSELLPIIDNLESAIANLSKNATAEDKEGIELTLKSFESTLDKFGMVPIYPDNEEFNPEKHEAVSMEQNKDKKDGYVGNIMQRGWELHSRVLRPARVTVVKN